MLKKQQQFYVFDVETWGLDATPKSFALGVIYGDKYRFETTDINELRRELLSLKGSIVFAHNAKYDLLTTFGNIITSDNTETVFNGSRFILAKKEGVTFADSMNIFPTSLEKLGVIMGVNKGITPEKFKIGKRGKITQKDFDYCEQDCRIIYLALDKIFKEIGCVRTTLASLSMAYFRRKFVKGPIYYKVPAVYEFFNSYYGGRTECFVLGKTYAQKFDINSMYPYAMKVAKFPDTSKLVIKTDPTLKFLDYCLEFYEGLAYVTVKHKKHYFGFLPYRHNNKLCFPVGTFSGCWNFNELRFAIEQGIIEITDVTKIVYAPAVKSIFAEFVDELYNRRKASKSDFDKYQLKLILNSLYGKFAQKKAFDTKYVENLTSEDIANNPNAEIVPFSNDRNDAYIVTEKESYSYNTIPLFSSYTTSFARVHLLKLMLQYEENGISYIDTDSLAMSNYHTEVLTSDDLGAFKKEDKIITEILGNKSYVEKDGNIVLKGVTKGSKLLAGGVYTTKAMISPKEALRRGMEAGSFINKTKVNKAIYDKRQVFPDGSTLPLVIGEQKQLKIFA